MPSIEERLRRIREQISQSCEVVGRSPREVTLVGVSKTVDRAAIDEAYAAGLRDFGENRIQDAIAKLVDNWPPDAKRHLIGSLQTNKAAAAVRIFDLIHSVDRVSLIDELRKQATRHERTMSVLLQVNVAGEGQKSGCQPVEALALAQSIVDSAELTLHGLMTIAPLVDDPEMVRPVFASLKALRDQIQTEAGAELPILSMGMTNDFEIAIQEGATHIRVGRALFDPTRQ